MARTVQYISQDEISPDQIRRYFEPLLTSILGYLKTKGKNPEDEGYELDGGYYDNGSFGFNWLRLSHDAEDYFSVWGIDNDDGTADLTSIEYGNEE